MYAICLIYKLYLVRKEKAKERNIKILLQNLNKSNFFFLKTETPCPDGFGWCPTYSDFLKVIFYIVSKRFKIKCYTLCHSNI